MSAVPEQFLGAAANDADAQETREWLDALSAVLDNEGRERGHFLLEQLLEHARQHGVDMPFSATTAYVNTIEPEDEPRDIGNIEIEERLRAYMRWNAMAMVVKANRLHPEDGGDLGGHISSFASVATMFGAGFNHFWHADTPDHGGDLLYIQGHSAPGIYARAFMEGRITEEQLLNFRQEVDGKGLSSYPHPKLMPEFWQFPTVSMGLGPLMAIYQARFLKYLHARGIADTSKRKVWVFCGDGEMDEPESLGAIGLAAREKLDNLIFVINCNLQRLDGPVRGNGRIVDELESLFHGAGWNVVKCLWGSEWDELLARDHTHAIAQAFAATVDGEFQTLSANDGAFNRRTFFAKSPALSELVAHLSDEQIEALRRGGHDPVKIHAAFALATQAQGRPSVVLAKTMKGYGMGSLGQGRMTTHQQKKLDADKLLAFRDRFQLPLGDEEARSAAFLRPDPQAQRYLQQRRAALGGCLPQRRTAAQPLPVPAMASYATFALEAEGKSMSTTMAVVRMLGNLLKDAALGPRIVPIVADEARTFGMASLFRQVGIYAPFGQLYQPEDAGSMLSYREDRSGQMLEEGISEAGALSSWTAAATSYSTHGLAMLPFYIYYSMFGFQRVGDLIWAAADQRARGFLIGATSGRTTLGGEGLQHQDGTSHLAAATIPNCRAYDPAFAGELAVIVDHGMRRMLADQADEFFYITVTNENVDNPSLTPGVHDDVVRGMYLFRRGAAGSRRVQLLGSGAVMGEVLKAAAQLEAGHGVSADVWSVTSYAEMAREGIASERHWRHGHAERVDSWFEQRLRATTGPIVATTDYARALPEMVRPFVPPGRRYLTLGTDGFGCSDTRGALRSYFEIDAASIVQAALRSIEEIEREALARQHEGLVHIASLAVT